MKTLYFATVALWKREILRFVRQRSRWIGALLTPLMFWVLVGGGLGQSFRDSRGEGYFQFFYPGSVALAVLFTAIFSTISVIEDRNEGFLQGVMVSPVSRGAIVFSKIIGGATLGLMQGVLLLLLAPVAGIHLTLFSIVASIVLIFFMAAALTSLGFFFAWKTDSVQGYHGIMNMVLMPMWILSGAVFPASTSHPVFQWITRLNPLTYAMTGFREVLQGTYTSAYPLALVVLAVFLALTAAASQWLVSRSVK